uniref:Uncharacterized protein n=1 Tax=viral metagenome TaxID=1070528 RepID=A0A6C0H718_9ZZZZ
MSIFTIFRENIKYDYIYYILFIIIIYYTILIYF